MFKVLLRPAVAIALVSLLAACDVKFDYESIVDRAAIRVAKTKWKEKGIKDYNFVYQEHCFCKPTDGAGVRVEVRDDNALQAVGAGTGIPFSDSAVTIDQLFDRVLEASKDGADDFSIDFDSERNFIKQVSLDPNKTTTDDEYGFEIPCFSPEETRCAFPLITPDECTAQQGVVTEIPSEHPESVCSSGIRAAHGQVERDVSVCCVN